MSKTTTLLAGCSRGAALAALLTTLAGFSDCGGLDSQGFDSLAVRIDRVASMSGVVRSAETAVPVAGARVQVEEKSATTDGNGYFTIDELGTGEQLVLVTAAGYQDLEQTVPLEDGANSVGPFELQPAGAATGDPLVRLLFAVDRSSSMIVADPEGAIPTAIAQVVQSYLVSDEPAQLDPDVRVTVATFASSIRVLTTNPLLEPGFSGDAEQVLAAAAQLASAAGGWTNYQAGLGMVRSLIEGDLALVPASPPRPVIYQVFWITDGLPTEMCVGSDQSPAGLLSQVESLAAYTAGRDAELRFNSVASLATQMYGFGPDACFDLFRLGDGGSVGDQLELLLGAMAAAGAGVSSVVENGATAAVLRERLEIALDDDAAAIEDADRDGLAQAVDNCPLQANQSQTDHDGDGVGDACDPDRDGDQITNAEDNCAFAANAGQADTDGDGVGDICDHEGDGDGVADLDDNCPHVPNAQQLDTDGDGAGDVCDSDDDGDGVPDSSDPCRLDPALPAGSAGCEGDADQDGVRDPDDNCPYVVNPAQTDGDGDGFGVACDLDDSDAYSYADDYDSDGWEDDVDNCPFDPNPGQQDADGDGLGDACDPI